eukprot:CAMPEP_0174231098 /NCGR_PEP_ID=MMETSP0417-20130205/1711_1 /TAXON_ID=242541 /ORGANISM="Mayorella sp, Strain BSH-02190019" /LENGTH=271 /DNA_ID=CAMNT_0015308919 /DNA_START=40 /DNA_END=855 /DNA_ORIENTATION=-
MPQEHISPEGLRLDGRRANELRRVQCRVGLFGRADGSAYFALGNTKVLAAVYGPRPLSLSRVREGKHDRALIRCEYSMAAFSTGERKSHTKNRRAMEIAHLISETFESVVQVDLFPQSEIAIYIQVLQADGGQLSASINAATLALVDAGVPMRDLVCACAGGFLQDTAVLDLNFVESAGASSCTLPLALLPHSDRVVTLQLESRLPLDRFEEVLHLTMLGCKRIAQVLAQELKEPGSTYQPSRHPRPSLLEEIEHEAAATAAAAAEMETSV